MLREDAYKCPIHRNDANPRSSLTNPGRDPPPPRPPAVADPRVGRGLDGPGLPGPGQRGAGSRRFALVKGQPLLRNSAVALEWRSGWSQRRRSGCSREWSRRGPGEEIIVWVLL